MPKREELNDTEALSYSVDGMYGVRENRLAYVGEREKYSAVLRGVAQMEDLRPFVVCVHALKSTSRMIGALELAEKAKEMELAGKRGDRGFILKNLSEFCSHYDRICDTIVVMYKNTREDG